ncbi:MAG: gliding motility-associated C-terminal domain-containing protein, partial [Bacteroidales bacterium]|nr:gliding motility-associated C-terminal domain-containing protein [Bacteroidales bacterium]
DVITDALVNKSDTAQLVRFIVTPYVQGGNGGGCPGIPSIAEVWVEPTPKVVIIPQADTICDGDDGTFRITSPTGATLPVRFDYILIYDADITADPSAGETMLHKNDIRSHTFDNQSDTVQLVRIIVYPYTVDLNDNKRCEGIADTVDFWVEPTPVLYAFTEDTICNFDESSFVLRSPTGATLPVQFWYRIEPVNPDSFNITFPTTQVYGFGKNDTIIHDFENISDTAQLVHIIAAPYTVRADGSIRCTNGTQTATLWVEPTAKVHFSYYADTICSGFEFVNHHNSQDSTLRTVTKPMVEVRFEYEIIPDNPAFVDIDRVPSSATGILPFHYFDGNFKNNSDTIQRVVIHVTPYLLDGNGNPKCPGIPDSIVFQVTPNFTIQDSARTYVKYNIRCHGNNDGGVYLYPKGGVLAFGSSYFTQQDIEYTLFGSSWPAELQQYYSDTMNFIDSLPAGIYNYNIQDMLSGCSASDTVLLREPEYPFEVEILETNPVTCLGAGGEVFAHKTGGTYFADAGDTTGYYTASWYQLGLLIDTLYADYYSPAYEGWYIVRAQDTNLCYDYDSIKIYSRGKPDDFFPTAFSDYDEFNVSCTGYNDGVVRAFATVEGEPHNLVFELHTDEGMVQSNTSLSETYFYNLFADDYFIVVTNPDNGCSDTSQFITLTEPEFPLSIDEYDISWYHDSSWNISCNWSNDGFIALQTVTGGRPDNYSYNWYKNNALLCDCADDSLANLFKGLYKVIVNDGYCYDSADIEVVAPDLLDFALPHDTLNNLCNGDQSGYIEVTAQGGELQGGDYIYSWDHDPGLDSPRAENLFAGSYIVHVEDGINCVATDTITLVEPDVLTIYDSIVKYNNYEIQCHGTETGQIILDVQGGTGERSYEWYHEEGDSIYSVQPNLYNGIAGNFNLMVTDVNGCRDSAEYLLVEPDTLTLVFHVVNKKCERFGSIDATVAHGVPTYTYTWDVPGETKYYIENLDPIIKDMFTLTVTDANGCIITDSVRLLEESKMQVEISEDKPVSCYGFNDGILNFTDVSPGERPFSVEWYRNNELLNDNDNDTILNEVNIGTYIVFVEDINSCRDRDTIEITQPDQLTGDFIITQASCYDTADGTITLNALGGTIGYAYVVNGIPVSNEYLTDLHAGNYKIEITDNRNCYIDTTVVLPEPDSLDLIETARIAPSCPESPDGELTVQALGGNKQYEITWIDRDVTGNTLSEITQGYYLVKVVDSMFCKTERRIYLEADKPLCLTIPSAFSPNGDGVNDTWEIINDLYQDIDIATIYPNLTVKIYNRWGQLVWISEPGYPEEWKGTDNSGHELPVDTYHYVISSNDIYNVSERKIVTIVR